MGFRVEAEQQGAAAIHRLADDAGNALAICPTLGFNAFSWQVEHGGLQELLWASPHFFDEGKPTRTGNPILFPFPNRIRDARFSWDGVDYHLPTTDANGKNAIHGFVCRLPWRVVENGAADHAAWITGEFHAQQDAPGLAACWPADYRIRATYRLEAGKLRLETVIDNPDGRPLPFGLGFHPYFALAGFGKEEAVIGVPARGYWPLEDCLPSGPPRTADGMRDLRDGRECGSLRLDDVLTDLDQSMTNAEGLYRFGWIDDWQKRRRLELFGSTAFREVVVFNPPHREAFCIEPYTCTTDAINLAARGFDAGWRVLDPGERWSAVLEFVFTATG